MSGTVLAMLAVVTVGVAAVAVLPRVEVRSPILALVRVLFPSWRFFDAISPTPELLARSAGPDGAWGEWQPVLYPPGRAVWNVLWHPQGNLSLAYHSLFERLLADVAELPDDGAPEQLVSYGLVLNLVRASLRDAGVAAGIDVQWKLVEPAPAVAPDWRLPGRVDHSPAASDLVISQVFTR